MALESWSGQFHVLQNEPRQFGPYAGAFRGGGSVANSPELFILVEPLSPLVAPALGDLLPRLGAVFEREALSLTGALIRCVGLAHEQLRHWNMKSLPAHRAGLAVAGLAMRGEQAYLAQAGPAVTYLLRAGELRRIVAPQDAAMPVGVADTSQPDFNYFALRSGDTFLLAFHTLERDLEQEQIQALLADRPDRALAEFYRALSDDGDFAAMIVTLDPPEGTPVDLPPLPRRADAPPVTAPTAPPSNRPPPRKKTVDDRQASLFEGGAAAAAPGEADRGERGSGLAAASVAATGSAAGAAAAAGASPPPAPPAPGSLPVAAAAAAGGESESGAEDALEPVAAAGDRPVETPPEPPADKVGTASVDDVAPPPRDDGASAPDEAVRPPAVVPSPSILEPLIDDPATSTPQPWLRRGGAPPPHPEWRPLSPEDVEPGVRVVPAGEDLLEPELPDVAAAATVAAAAGTTEPADEMRLLEPEEAAERLRRVRQRPRHRAATRPEFADVDPASGTPYEQVGDPPALDRKVGLGRDQGPALRRRLDVRISRRVVILGGAAIAVGAVAAASAVALPRILGDDREEQAKELTASAQVLFDEGMAAADEAVKREKLRQAQALLEEALALVPDDPAALALMAEITAELAILNREVPLEDLSAVTGLATILSAPGSGEQLEVAGGSVFLLDGGADQVIYFQQSDPEGALIVFQPGLDIDGVPAPVPVEMAYLDAPEGTALLIAGDDNTDYLYTPAEGEPLPSPVGIPGREEWGGLDALVWTGDELLAVDLAGGTVYRYRFNGSTFLRNGRLPLGETLPAAVTSAAWNGEQLFLMGDAEDLYRLDDGGLVAVEPAGLDRDMQSPQGISADTELGHVYVSDRGNNRIVVLTPDGTFVQQLVSPELVSLGQISVDGPNAQLYLIAGDALYSAPLPVIIDP